MTITKKKGCATYILYQYSNECNQDKRYTILQRTIIGKVSPDDPTLMYPNERFQAFFRLLKSQKNFPLFIEDATEDQFMHHHPESYRRIPTAHNLTKRFGEETGLILDLAAYPVNEEENAGKYYPDFAITHLLFSKEMKIYSNSKVCRLLQSIIKDQCISFLDDWTKGRDFSE